MIEKQNLTLEEFEGTRARLPSPPTPSFPHSFALILLLALALGSALATLSQMWAAVVCAGLCGVFGISLWRSANLPLAQILQVVLLASFGCGSAFDIICGDMARAPRWMRENGLEWLHRMLLEPKRLGRRYLIEDRPFILHFIAAFARRRFLGNVNKS